MLRTTNKHVITALRAHILDQFVETAEYERDNGNPTATPLSCLVSQIDYMRYNDHTIYQTALDWVEGGSALVYYGDIRDFLASILDEGDEEKHRFSDDKVFKLYCHLMAREISKLYTLSKEGKL